MILGRVIGEIHSTIQHPFYQARKLLVVERTSADGVASGGYLVAVDVVDAGVGDPVLVLEEGNAARQVTGCPQGPVRSIVIGIIDAVRTAEAADTAGAPSGSGG